MEHEAKPIPEDLSKYLMEMKREALNVLVPEPLEIEARIPLVTHLRGRHPDLNELFLALVEWEGWKSIEDGREMDWKGLDPGEFLKEHAPSISAKRAEQIVRIAQTPHQVSQKQGFWSSLLRRH